MTAPRRLSADDRRARLLEVAAQLFAERPYDAVSMADVADRGGISRALLYRHFPSKRELFAAMYQQAADRLLSATTLDGDAPMAEQIEAGLDAHFDYFEDNRNTVLAANRTLAGDPTIQAIIEGELAALRERMITAAGVDGADRRVLSTVLMGWLVFVRVLSVEWLTDPTALTRSRLREICVGALLGALGGTVDVTQPPAAQPRSPG